jgi:uncharacterized protein involved in response to NO
MRVLSSLFDHPFLGRGFRPFFLMGAVYAALLVPLWVLQMRGSLLLYSPFDDPVLWHGHEMVFGFAMAIVAGFLLTAVANWTGGAATRQGHLAGLCLLWLAGRVTMNVGVPYGVSAAVNMAFTPALAVTLAIPLFHSRNKRNFIFLALMGILFCCDSWLFLKQDKQALYLAILVVAVMISLIGGLIIPSFTVAALRRRGETAFITDQPGADKLALLSIALLALSWAVLGSGHWISALFSGAAAAIHLWRLRVWHTRRILNDPLLWILHLGYLWLAVSFVLLALSPFFPALPPSIALHALTAGAIGSMTIGMMVRVALGHTGRELKAGAGGILAFALMQGAIALRVVFPFFDMEHYMLWLESSSTLWAASYIVYLLAFAPVLWQPRPDGLPA